MAFGTEAEGPPVELGSACPGKRSVGVGLPFPKESCIGLVAHLVTNWGMQLVQGNFQLRILLLLLPVPALPWEAYPNWKGQDDDPHLFLQ